MTLPRRILLMIAIATLWATVNASAVGLHLWPVFALMWVIDFGRPPSPRKAIDLNTSRRPKPEGFPGALTPFEFALHRRASALPPCA